MSAHAAHPGYASTNLQGHTTHARRQVVMGVGNRVLAQSDAMGALPILHAATQDLPRRELHRAGRPSGAARLPQGRGPSPAAKDPIPPGALWDVSEELTGVRFPLARGRRVSDRAYPPDRKA